MKWISLPIFFFLLRCQSTSGWKMPESDLNNQADPASYAGDAMMFRKDMPHREDFKSWEFFYKHCSINSNDPFYARNSYDCAGPGF